MNQKQFYLVSPAGDFTMVEIFKENNALSLLIGPDYRIDIDLDSAFDLADSLLMVAGEMEHFCEE